MKKECPQGNMVCTWCPLRDVDGRYADGTILRCEDEQIVQCTLEFGSTRPRRNPTGGFDPNGNRVEGPLYPRDD